MPSIVYIDYDQYAMLFLKKDVLDKVEAEYLGL